MYVDTVNINELRCTFQCKVFQLLGTLNKLFELQKISN